MRLDRQNGDRVGSETELEVAADTSGCGHWSDFLWFSEGISILWASWRCRTVASAWDETPVIPSRMMCTFWTDPAALTALT